MKLQQAIGSLVLQILGLQEAAERLEHEKIEAYELLSQCIKSGQVPQEDVPKLLEQNKGFAEWYKNKYPSCMPRRTVP